MNEKEKLQGQENRQENPAPPKNKGGLLGFLEKSGNALPNPAILFAIFAGTVFVSSVIGSLLGWSGIHPVTGEPVYVVNLASQEGIHKIILEMARNFTSFAPLGIVMLAMLGIGVAEVSGLMKSAVNTVLAKTPAKWITFSVIFLGILSNVASDLGYVLIIPLAGAIFHSLGRNPFVGMACAFAAVSGGFAANILISTQDPLLAGISTEAAKIIDPNYNVLPTANYYFLAASTFFIAILLTILTTKFIEPRLGKYEGDVPAEPMTPPTDLERKGLKRAGLVCVGWAVLIGLGFLPGGILWGLDGSFLQSPVLRGFITLLFFMALTAGIVYGYTVGKFKKPNDVITGMNDSLKTLVSFMVLVFFAAQFVAWFNWSNLGLILAINGAGLIDNLNIGLIPMAVIFVIFAAVMNLFIGSASAKWAIIGPIFVPIFMLLGYSPELSQAVYRVGASVTNIVTPVMPYLALIIVFYQKYDKKAGIGTILSTMVPYSFVLFVGWTLLLILWILFEIPLGPGAPMYFGM